MDLNSHHSHFICFWEDYPVAITICSPLFASFVWLFDILLLQLSSLHLLFFWCSQNDYRGTRKRFLKLFFTNYVKNQAGKLQNSIKCLKGNWVSLMLLAYYAKLVGGARAEKLGGLSAFNFLIRMTHLNLLRYFPLILPL